ncbi:MAG: hypothetical protein ACTSVZ_07945 [Promethearchaeota archaeon]
MSFNPQIWNNRQEMHEYVQDLRQLIMHQFFQKALERIQRLPEVPEATRYEKLTQHISDLEEICRNNLRFLAEDELTKSMAEQGNLEESFEKSDKLLLKAYAVPQMYFITPATLEQIHQTKNWIKFKMEKERYSKSFWF